MNFDLSKVSDKEKDRTHYYYIEDLPTILANNDFKKGGAGSGHHGHVGRPGEVGGSGQGGKEGEAFSGKMKLNNLKAWNESQGNIMKEIGLNYGDFLKFGKMFAKTADDLGRIPTIDEFLVHWEKE